MKSFREFLNEATLGGKKYLGKQNPNVKGKTLTRGRYADEFSPEYDAHRKMLMRQHDAHVVVDVDSPEAKQLAVSYTKNKGKHMTHVATVGGYQNDAYTLRGKVHPDAVRKKYERESKRTT